MSVNLNLSVSHHVAAANSHTYVTPTEPLYLDRTLLYHDFIYLIEGEWQFSETIHAKEIDYLLKPNDVLILHAGNHHYTRLPCKANTRTFCIHITHNEADSYTSVPANVCLQPQISCSGNPKIQEYFKEIIEVFWSNDARKEYKMDALTTLLIHELNEQQSKRGGNPIDMAIQLINESPHKLFTTSELAALLRVNQGAFTRKFKEVTGHSPHAYQIDKKLEMIALQLEIEPDIRLKELAATFNFCDEFYLSKLFKRKYGLSPLQYKKKMSMYRLLEDGD